MLRRTKILALVALALAIVSTSAADQAWRQGTYLKRQVEGESLPISELLNDFGKAQRVPVIIDESVDPRLTVSVQYPEMSPEEYLDAITQDHGLIWYYSGGVIHVFSNTSLQSVLLPISAVDLEQLVATLKRLGVYSEKLPLTADAEYGLVYVFGPPRYIEEVQKIAQGIEFRVRQRASIDVDVEVFPLNYAWADDQVFFIGQNEVAVPGVATILRNLLSDQPYSDDLQGRTTRVTPYNRPSLLGRGLIRPYDQSVANAEQAAINSQIAAAQAEAQYRAATQAEAQVQAAIAAAREGRAPDDIESAAAAELAAQVQIVIQAEPRLNAVVIRDVRERMAGYREIIQQLDRPVGLVQIKASIIDVDANHAFQLGPPYNAIWRDNGRQRSFQARLDTTNANELLNTPDPGNLTIRLADNQVDQFLLNIKALESDGHARMISKPSVVTLDNTEAFLEESEEFFVRVSGFEQVDLFNVIVGTKLNIIPHIIYGPNGRQIKLTARIEDGARSATATVDEIPVVSRNTINTQAVLLEGQSLLVGGLMRENETKDIRGLPLLARIPKLGVLFRETEHTTERLERIVLLTPTIIDLPYMAGVDVESMFEKGALPPHFHSPYEEIPPPVPADNYGASTARPNTTVSRRNERLRPLASSPTPSAGAATRQVASRAARASRSHSPAAEQSSSTAARPVTPSGVNPIDRVGQATFTLPVGTAAISPATTTQPAQDGAIRRLPSLESGASSPYASPRVATRPSPHVPSQPQKSSETLTR